MAKGGKDKNSVSLPKAWKTIKRSNDMKASRENFKDLGGLIAGLIVAALVAFILLGGINQRAFVETMFKWSEVVGHKVSSWFESGGIEVTEDGVYLNPNGNNDVPGHKDNTDIDNEGNDNNTNSEIDTSEQSAVTPNDNSEAENQPS